MVSDAVLPLRSIKDAQTALIEKNGERQETAIKHRDHRAGDRRASR
jgi:hypothetical protein